MAASAAAPCTGPAAGDIAPGEIPGDILWTAAAEEDASEGEASLAFSAARSASSSSLSSHFSGGYLLEDAPCSPNLRSSPPSAEAFSSGQSGAACGGAPPPSPASPPPQQADYAGPCTRGRRSPGSSVPSGSWAAEALQALPAAPELHSAPGRPAPGSGGAAAGAGPPPARPQAPQSLQSPAPAQQCAPDITLAAAGRPEPTPSVSPPCAESSGLLQPIAQHPASRPENPVGGGGPEAAVGPAEATTAFPGSGSDGEEEACDLLFDEDDASVGGAWAGPAVGAPQGGSLQHGGPPVPPAVLGGGAPWGQHPPSSGSHEQLRGAAPSVSQT